MSAPTNFRRKIRVSRLSRSDADRHTPEQRDQRLAAHAVYAKLDEFNEKNNNAINEDNEEKIIAATRSEQYKDYATEIIGSLNTPDGATSLLAKLNKTPNPYDAPVEANTGADQQTRSFAAKTGGVRKTPERAAMDDAKKARGKKDKKDKKDKKAKKDRKGKLTRRDSREEDLASITKKLNRNLRLEDEDDMDEDSQSETKSNSEKKSTRAPKRKISDEELQEEVAKEVEIGLCPECELRLCKRGCDLCHQCDRKNREDPVKALHREIRDIQRARERERKSRKDRIMAEELLRRAKKKLKEEREAEDDAFLTDASDPE